MCVCNMRFIIVWGSVGGWRAQRATKILRSGLGASKPRLASVKGGNKAQS